MKTTRRLILSGITGMTAAFCSGLTAGALAQSSTPANATGIRDSEPKGTLQNEPINQTDQNRSKTLLDEQNSRGLVPSKSPSQQVQGPVGTANKVSSLIGMDVRNSHDERLGEIKDIVVDLPSGKVAYAVLSVGGFLGIGDKTIAVPSSAFTVAPDQNRLVLNADKAKIQNAPAFARDTWPDLNSQTWSADSSYWSSDSAQGTSGAIATGAGSSSASSRSYSTDPSGSQPESDRTATLPSSTLTTTRIPDSQANLSGSNRESFHGQITSIDPQKRTMTVKGPSGSRDFKFSERPNLTLKDSRNPSLVDLKVGFPVTVGFHEENGTYVAHTVVRSDAPEVR